MSDCELRDLASGAASSPPLMHPFLRRWVDKATELLCALASSGYVKSAMAEVTGLPGTTSTTYVNVPGLSVTMTTGGGFLLAGFYGTANAVAEIGPGSGTFRLAIDGAAVARSSRFFAGTGASLAIRKRIPVSAGAHTVTVQWRADDTFSVSFNTTTDRNAELIVEEVKA